jgi:hypothetical protein
MTGAGGNTKTKEQGHAEFVERIRIKTHFSEQDVPRLGRLQFVSLRKVYEIPKEPQSKPAQDDKPVNFCAGGYTAEQAFDLLVELVRRETGQSASKPPFHYESWDPFGARADVTAPASC